MNTWTHSRRSITWSQRRVLRDLPFGREVLPASVRDQRGVAERRRRSSALLEMIDAFEAGAGWLPAIVGLSAPGGDSDPDALAACDPPMTSWEPEMPASFDYWCADPATGITCPRQPRRPHAYRRALFRLRLRRRDPRHREAASRTPSRSAAATGVSVGQVNDPELLCALTAAALLGGQGWTFMSGNGVFWNGAIHEMPGFEEVARLPTFLPTDIATFPVVCHAGTRFAGVRISAAVDPTRAEHAIAPDGRFVIVVHTPRPAANALPCERACAEFTVINMLTGLVERTGPLAAGESFSMAASRAWSSGGSSRRPRRRPCRPGTPISARRTAAAPAACAGSRAGCRGRAGRHEANTHTSTASASLAGRRGWTPPAAIRRKRPPAPARRPVRSAATSRRRSNCRRRSATSVFVAGPNSPGSRRHDHPRSRAA